MIDPFEQIENEGEPKHCSDFTNDVPYVCFCNKVHCDHQKQLKVKITDELRNMYNSNIDMTFSSTKCIYCSSFNCDVEHKDQTFSEEYKRYKNYNLNLGRKFDQEKLRFSLLPMNTIIEAVKVLQFGSKKYADFNWQKVDNARERYYNAAMRHLVAWWDGEKLDPETQLNHCAHAMVNIIFLLWFDLTEKK